MMDKDWVHNPIRVSKEYLNGARRFIEMAQANLENSEKILCPCYHCLNGRHQCFDTVYEHLVINGMDPTYNVWVFHGERPRADVQHEADELETHDKHRMYQDVYFDDNNVKEVDHMHDKREENFRKSLEDAETPLFSGCTTYTRISVLIALYKHKAAHNLSDIGFDELLNLISDMLLPDNTLPSELYETKKIFKIFDLGYEKIHACPNDCCLFRKEYESFDACPKCGASRWKVNQRSKKILKDIPSKVLRYFPIIPRLRRMLRSPEKAELLLWHSSNKSQDGKMRHPVDSLAWNTINCQWPNFASDPRNLRFGLTSDGFNPFGDLSSRYSCWPVILVVYNLPPWLCMIKDNMMLTLLIPGPKQPGNDIDVFLQPLIEDLKELWDNGVDIYDAFSKSIFNLRAILMWTINDFPAYGNLSDYSTKGKAACPTCGIDTCSQWLPCSRKFAYMGHRRFLTHSHLFRKKSWFDGKDEQRGRSGISFGSEILHAMKDFQNNWGKAQKKRRKTEKTSIWPWKKKSIFFELSYWESLILRHNLDVMHIEKNVCESIIGTLLNVKGKSKDGLNSRLDLQEMSIRDELYPIEAGKRYYLPSAPHTLSSAEKKLFCTRLQQFTRNRNEDMISQSQIDGRPISRVVNTMSKDMLDIAHRYVLFNTTEVEPYMEMHKQELKLLDKRFLRNESALQKKHMEIFSAWLENEVRTNSQEVSSTLKWLAYGPRKDVTSYSGYIINGRRFHTKSVERSTQNSGVSLEADTICQSSSKDTTQAIGRISYYGVLRDIILLDYCTLQVTLFHCDWANINNGVKVEEGFTLVNLHEGLNQFQRDPFILASQAKQVFYSRDTETPNWYVVLNAPQRGFHEKEFYEDHAHTPPVPLDTSQLDISIDNSEQSYTRLDCEGITV